MNYLRWKLRNGSKNFGTCGFFAEHAIFNCSQFTYEKKEKFERQELVLAFQCNLL